MLFCFSGGDLARCLSVFPKPIPQNRLLPRCSQNLSVLWQHRQEPDSSVTLLAINTLDLDVSTDKRLTKYSAILLLEVGQSFYYPAFRCSTKCNTESNVPKDTPKFSTKIQLGVYILVCQYATGSSSFDLSWDKRHKCLDDYGACLYFHFQWYIHPFIGTEHPVTHLPQYWVQEGIKR